MLLEFELSRGDGTSFGIEQYGARRGRALIDRQHMIGSPHGATIGSAQAPRKGVGGVT
jgi:hypothetical protein